jgi:parallel beta-helix repeat protein
MANGQPICYFKDQTGITVPAGAGQIIMANCSDMLIENQSLSDVDVGIELAFCAGTNVTDNNCSNDTDGVQLLFSNNNSLVNNTCSSNDGNGIFLLNSRNNSLSGNNCSSGNSDGIIAYSSDGLSLSNNTCSGNEYGTRIFDSDKVSLADNNFSSNILYGIQLENCDNSTLSNNSCFWNDDYYGIQLYESVNVTLERNNLVGDGILIGGDALAHFNTHSIDTSNTANGRPIYYYKDQIGIAVPAGAGQVLMANCTDMRVENQNLSDAGAGVELVLCTGTTVTNSICSNNEYGVFVGGSPNSTLIDNTCSYCRYGIVLWRSDNNTLVGNNCSSNSEDGVWLAVAQDNSLISNNCSSNGGAGVNLYYSSRNSLIGNNCSSCYYGINIYDTCDDNILHLNWIGYNVGYGIYLGWGYHTRIWNNTFTDNNGAGSTYDPNHVQACDSSGCNWWNSTDGCGNYWSDWTAPDNDSDGIVDYPYVLDGTAGARDYSPLTTVTTEPIPEFGMMPFVVMVFLAAVLLTREARRRKAQ